MSDRQYVSLAGPIIVSAAAETITVDKWANQPPPPVRRKAATALLVASMVVPVFVPLPADAPQTCDRWKPNYPDRIHRLTLPSAAHLTPAVQNLLPLPTILSPQGGSVYPTGSYTLWQYQQLAGPLDIPAPEVPVLNWQPTYPDAIRLPKGLKASAQQAYTADRFDPPAAIVAPTFGWVGQGIDQARGKAPQTYRAQTFAMDTQWTAPAQNIATTLWMPKGVDRPSTRIYPRAVYTWAQPHFVIEVNVPVMSWTGIYLDPPMRAKSQRALYGGRITSPTEIADITTSSPSSSWDGWYPDQVPGPRRSTAAQNARGVVPVFVADVSVVAPTLSASAIYPDRIAPKPSLGAAQRAWTMDATYTGPVVVAAPSLAKPVYPDRVFGRPQPTIHPDVRTAEYVLDVTLPAPRMSWAPSYPDRPVVNVRVPELRQTIALTIQPPPIFQACWVGPILIFGPVTPPAEGNS